jgi:hypothetical protein
LISKYINVSSTGQLGGNGEFLLDVHAESWPPVAWLEFWLERINVDNVPLLIKSVMSLEDDHVLVLSVLVS